MNFKSIIDLLTYFSDEQKAVEYYANIRWGDEPTCPHCGTKHPYKTNRGYKCRNKNCHKKFTVRTGTIFENSKIPFRVWFAAIYLATSSSKGVSSVQLARQLGVTQKTAWFVLHRVREMLKEKAPKMLGEESAVEADEAYIGQKDQNKHYGKRRSEDNKLLTNDGSPYKEKRAVLGIIERNGKVALKYVPSASKENMVEFIEKHVPKGSKLYTDEFRGYASLGKKYNHATVKHGLNVYVTGDVHTNTIENFWSILKRGLYGIYHSVSDKHLERYLDEFAARFNNRQLGEQVKFDNFLGDSESPLSYKKLVKTL